MIRLGALFPKHLNLNGDLGNLEVLAKQFEWRGLTTEIIPIESPQDLTGGVDLIFVGHGSTAAWSAIEKRFMALVPSLRSHLQSGTPGLTVSSGFAELVRSEVFSNLEFEMLRDRASKFIVHQDSSNEILGYLNADIDLPMISREQNWIGTMLHGPILAKNPSLLNEVLHSTAAHANIELPALRESGKAGLVADLIVEVWKLERELASE